jgi:hypothetical protein
LKGLNMEKVVPGMDKLVTQAVAGDENALTRLSLIAFGGDEGARAAIAAIDKKGWKPKSGKYGGVWPQAVERGERGPQAGDVMLGEV